MSSSHANGTTDVTQQPVQANGEGNLRSDIKIRDEIGEAGQKDKLTYVSLMYQIKQATIMFMIFWDYLIIKEIFLSPQVKWSLIVSNKLVHTIYRTTGYTDQEVINAPEHPTQ